MKATLSYLPASYLHRVAINKATIHNIPELVALINSAYRGEVSQTGWTSEAHLLKGVIRTDQENLTELMQQPGAVFLKYTNEENIIEGCVYLQQAGDKLYLGMLTVSPLLQAKGIGKRLMNAAHLHAKEIKSHSIYMRVISVRHELVAWYEKQGFVKTGKKEDFPTDNKYGIPTQPLEFLILEKQLEP